MLRGQISSGKLHKAREHVKGSEKTSTDGATHRRLTPTPARPRFHGPLAEHPRSQFHAHYSFMPTVRTRRATGQSRCRGSKSIRLDLEEGDEGDTSQAWRPCMPLSARDQNVPKALEGDLAPTATTSILAPVPSSLNKPRSSGQPSNAPRAMCPAPKPWPCQGPCAHGQSYRGGITGVVGPLNAMRWLYKDNDRS